VVFVFEGEERVELGKGENGSFHLLRKSIEKPEGFSRRSEATSEISPYPLSVKLRLNSEVLFYMYKRENH